MKEYKTISLSFHFLIEDKVNILARDGWRVVSVSHSFGGDYYVLLEREKPSDQGRGVDSQGSYLRW